MVVVVDASDICVICYSSK